ncbi:hypothetical protein DRW41_03910 [Neobacillus piezotolerans]|uniref:Proteinase inhibitor n=1 Tax=Neobacillus piezotolerans TaxID=2259171 RepID=A0A3D8GW83_9BACI|nr:hypothetical protein [Neobacillus piezotolerans]RDU38713.1 hypothetical protein DRW41_03910 [Neobacillus piezotolerans]
MKSILLGLLTFSIFFMAGCTNGNQGDGPIEDELFRREAFIEVNGNGYELKRGGYRWETRLKSGQTRVEMTDHASPFQMASSMEAIKLEPNQQVKIRIDGDPKIEVYDWNEGGRGNKYELSHIQFVAPANKGEYIFEVFSKWKNGEASYTFVVDVQ